MFNECELFNYEMIAKRYGMTTKKFLELTPCYRHEMIEQYVKMMMNEKCDIQENDNGLIKQKKLFERKKR